MKDQFMYPKNDLLTAVQKENMKDLGIHVDATTIEADCLKVLRKKKFPGFGENLKTKVSCD